MLHPLRIVGLAEKILSNNSDVIINNNKKKKILKPTKISTNGVNEHKNLMGALSFDESTKM